jgi:L-alanine-DL-glutamate epimerase-like enolase superfamily enzyme
MGVALPITALRTRLVSVPTARLGFERPLGNAVKSLPSLDYVILDLVAGDLQGLGYAFTPGHGASTIRACIEEALRPVVIGADALAPRELWEAMWSRLRHLGPQGIATFAMAAVDIACWDLAARAHGLPLHRLLGHAGRPLPVYATVGMLSLTMDELRQQTEKALERGVHGVKLMVGHPDPRVDAERVRVVAEMAGPSRRVMIDCNCVYRSVPEALDRMAALRELPVFWVEEPLQPHAVQDLARFRARAPFKTASGESVYSRYGIRQLLEADAVDIVQPDIFRLGGVTECLRAFALIESHDVPIAPHHFPELMTALLGASPNALYIEYLPYFVDGIFERAPVIERGAIAPLNTPGHGLRFHPDVLRAAVE